MAWFRFTAGMFAWALLLTSANGLTTADGQLSPGVLRQIAALEREKASRTEVEQKIDSHLLFAHKMEIGVPIADNIQTQRVVLDRDQNGAVLVDITADVTEGLLQFIKAHRGEVISAFREYRSIRARVALNEVAALAARADVAFVSPAGKGHHNNVDSEGDTTHQANLARQQFGVDGAGVKVGIISDSVDHLTNSQVAGLVAVLPGQDGIPGTGEGTAMLEIVNDLAPGALLYFATAKGGAANFANNIMQLRAAGCDIIVDDELYPNESPFQDGPVAVAVNAVTADGCLYFSAAANYGNLDMKTSGTWEGDFSGGGDAPPALQSGQLHEFGGGTSYNTVVARKRGTGLNLFWANPLGGAIDDYDVFVIDSTGSNVVASSTTRQTAGQDPYEHVDSLLPGERISIVKYSGQGTFLHLDLTGGLLSISTAGQIRGHCCATDAIAVAAVAASNAYPHPFTGGAQDPVEKFSSDGPRRIFFQPNGVPITSGNYSSSGGTLRQKPDLAAADGVTTSIPAFTPFLGTSAAAPHAAAIAALVKSLNPTLNASQIRNILTSTALDIMAPGVDRDSGAGIIMALPALEAALPPLVSVSSPNPPSAKTLRLSFSVASGTTIQFEQSSDLRTWTAYGPQLTATNGGSVFQEVNLFFKQEYFRAKIIP